MNSYHIMTGTFPQEIIVKLDSPQKVRTIELVQYGIRSAECYSTDSAMSFTIEDQVVVKNMDYSADISSIRFTTGPKCVASAIKIKILGGFSDFVCIFRVIVS